MKASLELRVINAFVMVEAIILGVTMSSTFVMSLGQFSTAEYAVFLIPCILSLLLLSVVIGVQMSAALAIAWVPVIGSLLLLRDLSDLLAGGVNIITVFLFFVHGLWVYFALRWKMAYKNRNLVQQ